MKSFNLEADVSVITALTEEIDAYLEGIDCPMKAQMQIDIAIDEIFSNIARYGGRDGKGNCIVTIDKAENPDGVILEFSDNGVPYNPLEHEDPDTTLSVEDRNIGGLGIFMVKNYMNEMKYEYKDNRNVLWMRKNF